MAAYVMSNEFHPLTTLYAGEHNIGEQTKKELCKHIEYIQLDGDEIYHAEKILNKEFPTYARVYTIVGDAARQVFLNW